ncbi:MAG TPA: ATP-binding protein [Gemmatimonadaceae bacterium]|nr:ATP-binding protein [Gemmatimonadaceae bacterium]
MAESHVALDIEIPSDVNYIERVVELATLRCRELHIPAKKCSLNVRVALSEAISNAILRGNQSGAGKHVRVRATVSKEELVFDIVDEGPGFDLTATRPDPTTPENMLREDGRGLFLMHRLMDRVERFQSDGNVVRLTLRRE